jgi:hypothetical protein
MQAKSLEVNININITIIVSSMPNETLIFIYILINNSFPTIIISKLSLNNLLEQI